MKAFSSIGVFVLPAVLAVGQTLVRADDSAGGELLVYVGTANYTGPVSKAIFAFCLDRETGKLRELGIAGEASNPGFLAVHPNQRYLYAVNETGNQQAHTGGSVSAFAIESKSGMLKSLNKVPAHGAHPCHLVVDKAGNYVVVANYFGGAVESFPIKTDGQLGEAVSVVRHAGSSVNKERQEGPHPHGVRLSPDSRFAVAADLGIDKLMVHRFDAAKGLLKANTPPSATVTPGAGPRHVAFLPSGKFVYAVNELNSTVSAFAFDSANGTLRLSQTLSTLPKDYSGQNSGAEIDVLPSGKAVYVSNRGHDSIAVFAVDETKGTLTAAGHVSTRGKTPRSFAIDPSGRYMVVANQGTSNLAVFRIDLKSGLLSSIGPVFKTMSSPAYVGFAN